MAQSQYRQQVMWTDRPEGNVALNNHTLIALFDVRRGKVHLEYFVLTEGPFVLEEVFDEPLRCAIEVLVREVKPDGFQDCSHKIGRVLNRRALAVMMRFALCHLSPPYLFVTVHGMPRNLWTWRLMR